jgi:hypothetical protein
VVSTGYSGQSGNAAGGNINYITKSGSNEFHGNAQYYWNGRVFNANDWLNNALGNPRPFDIANQWAASFGGPISKDKLFFFFDTEGLRVFVPSITQVLIPSPQFEAATIANIDSRFGAAPPPMPSIRRFLISTMLPLGQAQPLRAALRPKIWVVWGRCSHLCSEAAPPA